jgi:DNA-binding NarL/FixJ family response regulator
LERIRSLIVDDEPLARAGIQMRLEQEPDIEVIGECRNGREAVAAIKLDDVGEKFRVLLIKTNMRIPYTSVFLELECGYWNSHAEKQLRSAMRSQD